MLLRKLATRRRAAHAVEFSLIAPVLFLTLFGCFEWCRYVMVLNVTTDALREGTRFAVARTDTLQTGIATSDIQAQVTAYLAKMGTQLTNVTVTVYKCNLNGQPMDLSDNIVTQASASTFDQTQFGDYVCVTLTGTYTPLMPKLLQTSNLTSVTATCIMCSEGN